MSEACEGGEVKPVGTTAKLYRCPKHGLVECVEAPVEGQRVFSPYCILRAEDGRECNQGVTGPITVAVLSPQAFVYEGGVWIADQEGGYVAPSIQLKGTGSNLGTKLAEHFGGERSLEALITVEAQPRK